MTTCILYGRSIHVQFEKVARSAHEEAGLWRKDDI